MNELTTTEQNGENQNGGMIAVAESRAAQEVQAAMVVAKRFPRDETNAFQKIIRSCKRRTLAEGAMYAYPKGGGTVTGPSIRLAEVLAQNWGNVDFGIIELEQRPGESIMMAYAWDLETNTRETKVFTVRHIRHTRGGQYPLNDPREIYELTANQGARRLRACILGIIPGDVVEAATLECEKTLRDGGGEPLRDRVRKMAVAFDALGVTNDMLSRRVGHKLEATNETELVNLRKIYRSIKDGATGVGDWFEHAAPPAGESADQALGSALGVEDDEPAETTDPPEQSTEPTTPAPFSDAALELLDLVAERQGNKAGLLEVKQRMTATALPDHEREEISGRLEAAIAGCGKGKK